MELTKCKMVLGEQKKIIDTCHTAEMTVNFVEETLSDKSLVYNVEFIIDNHRAELAFPTEKDAEALMDAIEKSLDIV